MGTEECAGGVHYLIAFADTTANVYDSRFPAQLLKTDTKFFALYIYSPVDQFAEVERGGIPDTLYLSGGQIYEYDTERIGTPIVTEINTPSNRPLRIRTQYPVIIYAYQLTAFGCAAFTPMPIEAWGKEYYVPAWPAETVQDVSRGNSAAPRTTTKGGPAEILIIAARNGTTVQIDPNGSLQDCAGCTQVTLNAGQTYLVQSAVDTAADVGPQPDLAGTFIRASEKIGVIAGNTRLMHAADTGLTRNSLKDLAVEWISPVEQYGTEFVFTPTWDDRRQRPELDPREWRRGERIRIFGADSGGTAGYRIDDSGTEVPTSVGVFGRGEFTEERIDTPVARAFRTSRPATAFASPEAVVKFNGTTMFGENYAGTSYLSWSTFMVELVPRERWTSFAPVRAPSLPSSMVHYLNLVADSANRLNVFYRQGNGPRQIFPFNRGAVPGTDLVWGSIPLNKGVDYFIEGEKGARFTGHAYGSYRGQEQYRPADPEEYEEDVALMYGYPLAFSRCSPFEPGEYEITTEKTACDEMTVRIRTTNTPTVGIFSIALHEDSSANVRLEYISPADPLDLTTSEITDATVRITAIDRRMEAHAVLIVKDYSSNNVSRTIRYDWNGERVEFRPDGIDFGRVTVGQKGEERMTEIGNPLSARDITIKGLNLAYGTKGFRITRTEPAFNWANGTDSLVLAPGESLQVWVNVEVSDEVIARDYLTVRFACGTEEIALRVAGAVPCLFASQLDFGTMETNQSRTRELRICNAGSGDAIFAEPWITWPGDSTQGSGFRIAEEDLERLKGKVLLPGECDTLRVTFTAIDTGSFSTTARFWANTRNCRDTSVWSVRVIEPSMGVAGEESLAGYALTAVTPNPLSRDARIDFRLGSRGRTVVEVFDANGRRTALLADEPMEAGENHVVWNAEGNPAGAYLIRIRSGAWSAARPVILVR